MDLVPTPEHVAPTDDETARVLDAVQNGRADEVLHFAAEYLAVHCADPFARQLIETAFARIEE